MHATKLNAEPSSTYQFHSRSCPLNKVTAWSEEVTISFAPFCQAVHYVLRTDKISPEDQPTPAAKRNMDGPSRRCTFPKVFARVSDVECRTVTHLYGGKPMDMHVAISRSEARTTTSSSRTLQASLTTGNIMNSTMSWSVTLRA